MHIAVMKTVATQIRLPGPKQFRNVSATDRIHSLRMGYVRFPAQNSGI
jgi:hypothetical protein